MDRTGANVALWRVGVGKGLSDMAERRLRTAQRKKRARAKFWSDHGEKVRLVLIGGSVVLIATWIAKALLGG